MNNIVLFFGLMLISLPMAAQEIPLMSWRTHFSYKSVVSVAETPNRIFAAADVGLFAVNKDGTEIQRYSTLDGFQGVDASVVYFDQPGQVLMVGYRSGNLDVVADGTVVSLDFTSDSQIIGSLKINDISGDGRWAYIATDYGILKFDPDKLEVRETYREIGPDAAQLGVNALVVNDGQLFATTASGVQAVELDGGNPADYRVWERFENFSGSVTGIAVANDRVYVLENDRIFEYSDNLWTEVVPATASLVTGLGSSAEGLLLFSDGRVEVMSQGGAIVEEFSGNAVGPVTTAVIDTNGTGWLGDNSSGLWRADHEKTVIASPSGPVRSVPFNLTFSGTELYALPGGYSPAVVPLEQDFGYTTFSSGHWDNVSLSAFMDVVDAREYQGQVYLASAGDGLLRRSEDADELFDESNSPLSAGVNGIIISALDGDESLYILNYGSSTPLLRLGSGGEWDAFILPAIARNARQLETYGDFAWLVLPASGSGGVFAYDMGSDRFAVLTDEPGAGGLASRIVNDVVLDQEGYLWIATARGVSVWFTPFRLDGPIDASEPIFDGRPLLVDNNVRCIAVDGGNRKWMGTNQGAWLFDAFADELIFHFTRDNSPLPSDNILDIAIDGQTGEVFFLTDEGMVSFRSDATSPDGEHSQVKIFPNPVEEGFQGEVAISGLVSNASVKVTDSAGRLVYETMSQGGTATWPVRQNPGGSPASGMYYVFSVSQDGTQTYVGKVAVIR